MTFISLLNSDQKILAKLLAGRLRTVTAKIINVDQSGFISNRYGSDNFRDLVDLQHNLYLSTHPTFDLSRDTAKAFDCVELGYLFKTLEKSGFGNKFIR